MKKTISVFLSLCLVLSMLMTGIVTAHAEGNIIEGTDITWNFNAETGELHFEGVGAIPDYDDFKNDSGDVELKYPWKDVKYTSIVFGEGITAIGNYAFCHSADLVSVTIPDTVTLLGKGIFMFCPKLEEVVLPNEVVSVSESMFSNCEALSKVTFGAKTTAIGEKAFYKCDSIKEITFPETLKSIGESAFHSCTSLEGITLPEGFTTLDSHVFYACEGVMAINLPSTLETLGECVFEGCRALATISFPASITKLPANVCNGCRALTSVTLSENLVEIGDGAFNVCPELKEITIPATVTSIGEKAIGYGKFGAKVTGFVINGYANSETVLKYADENKFNFNSLGYITSGTCGENATWEYKEDENTLYINGSGEMADYSADDFVAYNLIPYEKVVIAPEITKIGSYSFYGAAAMDFALSENITAIGEKAIGYYDNEGSPALREDTSITGFANNVIAGYAKANNINFISTGYSTNGSCGENATWEYKEDEKTLYINGSGEMTDYAIDDYIAYSYIPYEKVVIAPEITKIGSYAFYGAAAMDFALSENIVAIGEKAIGYYNNEGTPALREGTSITGYDGLAPMIYAAENNITFNSLGEFIVTEGKLGDDITWTYDVATKTLTVSGTGATYNYTADELPAFADYDIQSVLVSDGITILGDYAFCTTIAYSDIQLGKDISEIRTNAFGYIKAQELDEEGNPTGSYSVYANKMLLVRGYISTPADEYAVFSNFSFEALDGNILPLFTFIENSVVDHIKNFIIIYKENADITSVAENFPVENFIEVLFPETIGTGKTLTLVNENGTYTYELVVMGDNSGDGDINSADALNVLQHSVQYKIMEDDCCINASDINHDGVINSSDALAILQITVGNTSVESGYNPGIVR